MRRCMVRAMLVVAARCATAPPTAQGPCLPPGIAGDVFLWPVVESGTLGIIPVPGADG